MTTEALRIPDAYRAACDVCHEALDTRANGVCQYTHGWVMQRAGGGGHGVSCPERDPRWAHGRCVELVAAGREGQGALW